MPPAANPRLSATDFKLSVDNTFSIRVVLICKMPIYLVDNKYYTIFSSTAHYPNGQGNSIYFSTIFPTSIP